MILLDTDHVTVLRYPENPRCGRLVDRMNAEQAMGESLAVTVITVEEQLRGWLAEIGRHKNINNQIPIYDSLAKLFRFFAQWEIVSINDAAAKTFQQLRKSRIRIGTMDLKIAAIALAANVRLLSANLSDFRRVPNLRVENWLVD